MICIGVIRPSATAEDGSEIVFAESIDSTDEIGAMFDVAVGQMNEGDTLVVLDDEKEGDEQLLLSGTPGYPAREVIREARGAFMECMERHMLTALRGRA